MFSSEIMRMYWRDAYYSSKYSVYGQNVMLRLQDCSAVEVLRQIIKLFNSHVLEGTLARN